MTTRSEPWTTTTGWWGGSTWLPTYLATDRGIPTATVAVFMTVLNLGMFVGYNVFGTASAGSRRSHARYGVPIVVVAPIPRVEAARGRVPVIAGTGSNSTREAVQLTRLAHEVGADAMLVVAPYYNKPSQEGL